MGNMEDEVFICDLHATDGRVHACNEFLTVSDPSRSNTEGLLACLHEAMGFMGVANWESKLLGVDGSGRKKGTSIISTGRGPAMSRDHAQLCNRVFRYVKRY